MALAQSQIVTGMLNRESFVSRLVGDKIERQTDRQTDGQRDRQLRTGYMGLSEREEGSGIDDKGRLGMLYQVR